MGRETQFFIFDKEKAKNNLSEILSSLNYVETFKDFVLKRNVHRQEIIDYKDVLLRVESDINLISPQELFEIDHWMHQVGMSKSEFYIENGLHLLVSLHGQSAYGFMFQYGNFNFHYESDDVVFENSYGINMKSDYFIKYMDYMILILNKLAKEILKDEDLIQDHLSEVNNVVSENEDNEKLLKIIDNEFNSLKNYFDEYNNSSSENFSIINPEAQTIFTTDLFLNNVIYMKNQITNTRTNVLIIDSI